MNQTKKSILISFLLYIFVMCGIIFFLRPPYILSICLVLVPPALYNFFLLRESRKNIFIFSVLALLFFAFPIELIARYNNMWDVASLFLRPFGLVPLENTFFAFLNFFWGLSFYEYFVQGDTKRHFSLQAFFPLVVFALFSLVTYVIFFLHPEILSLSYLWLGIFIFIPAVCVFISRPWLIQKTYVSTLFFAVVFFVYEIVSLLIGSWWWPGTYYFSTIIFGHRFPLDDVLVWYVLSTPILIAGYEFCFKKEKK